MKPHSEEDIHSKYSKLLEDEESDDEMEEEEEDEEEEDDSDIDDNEENIDFFSPSSSSKMNVNEEIEKDRNSALLSSSQNGSSSSGTLGLYSSFDTMIRSSFDDSDKSYNDDLPKVDEHDISSHLKGTLSFGLPSKGNALRIHKPYKLIKRQKLVLPRSKKPLPMKGLNVPRIGNASKAELLRKIEKEMERDNIDHLDENLKVAYRIVIELMGESLKAYNSVFMEVIETNAEINGDYLQVVKEPIWLPKIKTKLLEQEYQTITEVISQIRLMLENAYRYFGANHSFSRKGLRLEYILEQKLSLLPKELRNICSLEVTHAVTEQDMKETTRTKSSSITVNGEQYFSYLLYKVKGCRQAREKEVKKRRLDLMRQAKVTKENEVIHWDANLMEGSLGGPFKNMWELVQINQFLYLSMNVLNVTQVSQYEMERILMIPEASITLRMLMTSLVSSRQQRTKIADKPYMPYNIWARQLANKTFHWYRVYSKESHNPVKLFEQLGIEPKFWLVCGEQNPFAKKLFHEMTLYQRVWLLKTLCDYIAHTHKSVQEAIAEQPEEHMREVQLGKDSDGNEYIYFPQFNGSDVRVYRRYRDNNMTFEDLEKVTGRKGKLFTKDQIKTFRKLIKKLKKNRERDDDWESEQRKSNNKLPKKRGRKPILSSLNSTPVEKRARPERLRQTPRPRYDLFSLESSLDEGEEDEFTISKNKRKEIDSESEDDDDGEEDEDEEEEEKIEEIKDKEEIQKEEMEIEKKKQELKIKKKIKEKSVCQTCGKSFKTKSAMYGHMAMHTRKKDKKPGVDDVKEDSEMSEIKNENDENLMECSEIKQEIKTEDDIKCDVKTEGEQLESDESMKSNVIKNMNTNNSCEMELQISTGDTKLKSDECEVDSVVRNRGNQDKKRGGDDETPIVGIADGSISLNSIKRENENGESKEEEPSRSESPSDDVGDNESSIGIPTPAESDLKSLSDPDAGEFELVAASFAELRNLISKFGSLPSKYARERIAIQGGEEKEEEDEVEEMEEKKEEIEQDTEKDSQKITKCEQKLHRALCKLLIELAPTEGKLNISHRQTRKKIWNEYLEWSKRDSTFVDPAEEAWKSDPEPEPTPSATQTPKQSSSSSSSEESFNDDGTRKRKLRKRKVKRVINDPPSPAFVSDLRAPSPKNAPSEDTIAVSSRGRVRKVKRIVDYDRLDFDKLAQQAEREAEKEKERKRKKKEEEAGRERALQEAADSLQIPSAGVRRYIISKEGEVVGYIGNDGQVHSGSVKVREEQLPDKSEQKLPAPVKKKPDQVDKTPIVVVSAYNEEGSLVYVRMIGNQALQLMKLISDSKNDLPRQIKLQKSTQSYTFNTNSNVITQNIPGYPDSDISNPQVLSKLTSPTSPTRSSAAPPDVSPKKVIATSPQKVHTSQAPLSASSSGTSIPSLSRSSNPVALAYQSVPVNAISSNNSLHEPLRPPQTSTCASLSAATRLVFASPSAVPSVPPITPSGLKLPALTSPATSSSPIIVQTENGQQLQIGLTSDRLSQVMHKAGQRVVAVPNDKGGYTISLISAVTPQGLASVKSITDSQSVRPNPQKSVITQLLPTVSSAGSTSQQQISYVKGRLPQQLVTSVPSQQIVPTYTTSSQVISSPSIARQVVIQHPGSTQDVVTSMTQPTQQIVHFAQSPMIQQQQQQQVYHIQQSNPQKLVQVVQTSSGRHLLQLLQPGQMLVTNNNINPSVSSLQQPTNVIAHSPQGIHFTKQPSVLQQQQQVIVQQPSQPTKIQVAHPDQMAHNLQQPIQYYQDSSQTKQQNIILQPQHYIVQQQQSQSVSTQSPAQTIVVKTTQPQTTDFMQQHELITHTPEQPLTQPLSQPIINTESHIPVSKEIPQTQLASGQSKESGTKQVGRVVLLQMSDGQKVYLQLPDGRMSMLTPEQLQPLINSGAIKFSS